MDGVLAPIAPMLPWPPHLALPAQHVVVVGIDGERQFQARCPEVWMTDSATRRQCKYVRHDPIVDIALDQRKPDGSAMS